MNQLPYNPKKKESILSYAKKLEGRTLRDYIYDEDLENEFLGKGSFGQLLEKRYFKYSPNSESRPDFPEANLELKSSPLKKSKGKFVSKERLVLNIINYIDEADKTFFNSSFWLKNADLLLVFYLHDPKKSVDDLIVKLIGEWLITGPDLEVIRRDWETIHKKIKSGKAHELSEGDTFYLGACTKGANSTSVRSQYKSTILAKQRAYSLKQGYVNHIIATLSDTKSQEYGKVIPSLQLAKDKTIEEIVISKFEYYYGKSDVEIHEEIGVNLNTHAKGFHASLTKVILGIDPTKEIEEFKKADIVVRTVRLTENFTPKEDISFPIFKYTEIINEEWDDSAFKETLERKFFFVFYKYSGSSLVLLKVRFWNMPYRDICEAEKVWASTKEIVSTGNIVKNIIAGERSTNFPGKASNPVSHVRPHAANAADTYPLPVKDKLTGATEYTKHCFWLNAKYVRDEIFLKY